MRSAVSTLAPLPAAVRGVAWRELLALTRPRVILVTTLTGGPALALGRGWPPAATVVAVLVGLVLLGAGCSALNAWIERDRDGRMARTRNRPLPAGRLDPAAALVFGIAVSAAGIATLGAWGSAAAAVLGVATLAWYLGAYTLVAKPRSAWSAVVGAAPGAAAPLIADAAVGGQVGIWGVVLFAIVFLWQPPHVWAIELFRSREHAAAGLPTLPAAAGPEATRRWMFAWVLVLVPVTLLPLGAGLGPVYAVVALGAGVNFGRAVVAAMRARRPRADRDVFLASLVHMTLIFAVMLVELTLR